MAKGKAPSAEEYSAIADALLSGQKQLVVCLTFGRSKNLVQRIAKEVMQSKKTTTGYMDKLQQLIISSGAKTPTEAARAVGCSLNQAEYIIYRRINASKAKQRTNNTSAPAL